jgi:hypothetical protein
MALSFTSSIARTVQSSSVRRVIVQPFITRQREALETPRVPHVRRAYSSEAIEPLEAPEYLSEGERKIFDMIKDGLKPIKLEVRSDQM